MKKIILSAAVAAMAFSTSAVAADKGIDIDVSGQAVIYYETHSDNGTGDKGLMDDSQSVAAAGVQLNLGSDLGNNFTFGSQITYLGDLGLDKSLTSAQKQTTNTTGLTTDEMALTKIFIAKKIGNTTVKAGRQELPKSLSPLAFTEGWNVYKNTFDAILAVNTDLPKTTVVGAYVTGGTSMSLGTTGDLAVGATGAAYMLTAQTKLIPITTLTGSYYALHNVGTALTDNVDASAYWVDAKIAPKNAPLGLSLSLQAAQIAPDGQSTLGTVYDDTNAFGAKLAGKAGAVSFKAVYTTVDGSSTGAQVQMRNTGTNIKTALYSQMMYNQKAITIDNDTILVGLGYDAGSIGKFAANYGMSSVGKDSTQNSTTSDKDYNELDLVYKVKSGGVQYFAIAAIRDWDNGITMNSTTGMNTGATDDTIIRFWARYNF